MPPGLRASARCRSRHGSPAAPPRRREAWSRHARHSPSTPCSTACARRRPVGSSSAAGICCRRAARRVGEFRPGGAVLAALSALHPPGELGSPWPFAGPGGLAAAVVGRGEPTSPGRGSAFAVSAARSPPPRRLWPRSRAAPLRSGGPSPAGRGDRRRVHGHARDRRPGPPALLPAGERPPSRATTRSCTRRCAWPSGRRSRRGRAPRRRSAAAPMKRIGLLGGMSWESSPSTTGWSTSTCASAPAGCTRRTACCARSTSPRSRSCSATERWDRGGRAAGRRGGALQRAGAELLVLCTNTMHKVADTIVAAIDIPFLHIADTTAHAVRAAGIARVGLLATATRWSRTSTSAGCATCTGWTVLPPEAATGGSCTT